MHARLEPVRQELDAVRTRPVAAVLLGALLLAGGSVLWSWLEFRADVAKYAPHGAPPPAPAEAGPAVVGGLLQTLIGVDSSAATIAARQRAKLQSWGWVDRAGGVVHIPIEAAMRALVEGGRAVNGPAPAAGPVAVPPSGPGTRRAP